MSLDLGTSIEKYSLDGKAYPGIWPPKNNLNLTLFGICNFEGMVEAWNKITKFKQQNEPKIENLRNLPKKVHYK
jgi:hypothetical protein